MFEIDIRLSHVSPPYLPESLVPYLSGAPKPVSDGDIATLLHRGQPSAKVAGSSYSNKGALNAGLKSQ